MEPDLTIVLLGHTGVGKSASGNTILGHKAFESKRSLKSVTKEISKKEGKVCGRQISVIDTPGILCAGAEEQIKTCCQEVLQSSRPHLFLVGIKIDRFTEESNEAVEAAVRVVGDEGLKHSYLLFTNGDALDDPLEEFINDPDGPLPPIVERFGRRYHLFNNKDNDQQQVSELLEKKIPSHSLQSESVILEDRRIVLLGLPGTGKSSSGNTILGSKKFKSSCGFGSVTKESVSASAEVEGRQVTVVDTPGFADKCLSHQQLFTEIVKSIEKADLGPHAFVIVVRIGRISSADIALFEILQKVFFRDALKHAMVLFTHGDLLKVEKQTIEEMIQADRHASELLSMFGGRYCVFNNGQRDRQQVRNLLNKVDEMVAANGGQYCTREIFKRLEEELCRSSQLVQRKLPDKSFKDGEKPLSLWELFIYYLKLFPKMFSRLIH
ncbi:GTPase IMAP family member 6-like [Scomber scombrus]|uniref:GTPase IMAP family member 6-like n=1 Tax=Scomber scombrus TaxID=13677 RepID=A0AAV1QMA1_SCOSC